MAVEVEGGSTEPENTPQMRQDAQQFIGLSQDPRLNGEKLLIRALTLMGVEQPEGYVKAAEAQIPAGQLQAFLAAIGVPPDRFLQWMSQQQQQAPPQGPNGAQPEQVAA
jgi:hypothetical protein